MKKINYLTVTLLILLLASCHTKGQQPSAIAGLEDGIYAEIQTGKGNVLLQLYYRLTPGTVANFVSLAEGNNPYVDDEYKGKPFFDGLTFHRVIQNFMIQGGDPTGTGRGGPGYNFDDEFPKNDRKELLLKHDSPGILSMANAGRNTNGSQFFITHVPTPHLDGKHTVFGKVVSGQNVVDSIRKGDKMLKVVILRKGKEAKEFDAPAVFDRFMKEAKERRKKELEEAEMRRKRSVEFIQAMARDISEKKAKAKTLPSGLKIYVESEGTGKKPAEGTLVSVDYAGFFEDGHLFDTSIVSMAKNFNNYIDAKDRAGAYRPLKVPYSDEARLIEGMKEAIQQMSYGEKIMVFIPSSLAYGKKGAGGGIIPPDTDLVFVLHLLEE